MIRIISICLILILFTILILGVFIIPLVRTHPLVWKITMAPLLMILCYIILLSVYNNQKSRQTNIHSKNDDKIWKYLQHDDKNYNERINFFLVAESMLVVSFTTINDIFEIKIGIVLLGFCYTLAWLYVNTRLFDRMQCLYKKLEEIDDIIFSNYSKKTVKGIYAGYILSWVLPISIFIFWNYLFWYVNK